MWHYILRLNFISVLCISFTVVQQANAQVDARVCYCFSQSVPDDFMFSSRAFYGTMGITLSRDIEIRPAQSDYVRFSIPKLPLQKGCSASYTLYVADMSGKKVFEATGQTGQFSYRFPACGTTYEVVLMAAAKSGKGSDGQCVRRVRFRVSPVCNQVVCECFMQKNTKSLSAGDLSVSGQVQCLPSSSGKRNYVVRFSVTNKTNCILNLQSMTVHGQTIEVPAINTAPKGTTSGMSLGFSTPVSQNPPADNKLGMLVRYSLNGRKCAMSLELPYQSCQ